MLAVAGRAAREQDVAGKQRHRLGGTRDEGGDVEEQVVGRAVLHDLAVQLEAHVQVVRVDERRRHEERAGRQEAGRVLGAVPVGADLLHVLAEDQVARRDVVDDRVPGDVVERVLAGDAERLAADHDGELELPVVHLAVGGEGERNVVSDDARGQPDEEVRLAVGGAVVHHLRRELARLFGRAVAVVGEAGRDELDHVLAVVRTGLQHLARLDRSRERHVGQRHPLLRPPRASAREPIPVRCRQEGVQARGAEIVGGEAPDAVAGDQPEGDGVSVAKAGERERRVESVGRHLWFRSSLIVVRVVSWAARQGAADRPRSSVSPGRAWRTG